MSERTEQIEQVKKLMSEAEKVKNEIAERRDRLREIIDELDDVAESCSESVLFIEDAISSMESSLDELSQYL